MGARPAWGRVEGLGGDARGSAATEQSQGGRSEAAGPAVLLQAHGAQAQSPQPAALGPSYARLSSPGVRNLSPVNIPFPCQGFFLFLLSASATRLDFLVKLPLDDFQLRLAKQR